MDTVFLQHFVEIIEHGSIAAVARKYGLTPTAVNLRIRKVEEELGFKLLLRSGRTVKPTAHGNQVLIQARRVLEEVRNLKAASQGPMVFGRVTIGAFDSAMTTVIPHLMRRLVDRHPALEITLVKGYSIHLYNKVCDGEIDVAVVQKPQLKMPKHIEWLHVQDDPLVVLAPSTCHETDPNQMLRSYPLICYDRTHWGGQLAVNYFRDHDIHPKIRIEAASIELIALLVSEGLGISLVPNPEGLHLQFPTLRRIPLASSAYVRRVGLLWNRKSSRAGLIEEIIELATRR